MNKWIEEIKKKIQFKKSIKEIIKTKKKEIKLYGIESLNDTSFYYNGYYISWTYIISATDDELKNKIRKIAKEQLSEYAPHFAECMEEVKKNKELCFISNEDGLFILYTDGSGNKQSRIICTHDDFNRLIRLMHDLDYPEGIIKTMRCEANSLKEKALSFKK